MATCPNINDPSFKKLEAVYGRPQATLFYHMNGEHTPSIEEAKAMIQSPVVYAQMKVLKALGDPKAQQLYTKFFKNNPEKFYSELLQLGAPKNQVDILRDHNSQHAPESFQDMVTSLAAAMSYTVEINTAKEKEKVQDSFTNSLYEDYLLPNGDVGQRLKTNKQSREENKPTQYYSNLTVPGGTNYTENEIATPGITPSIQSHAAFKTDSGIGWFRSDDRMKSEKFIVKSRDIVTGELVEEEINSLGSIDNSKTRRILEVQSDLFQKGRDRSILTGSRNFDKTLLATTPEQVEEYIKEGYTNLGENDFGETVFGKYNDDKHQENQFLQLLNKDGNWIPFFIKSIVQDSAKQTVMEIHPEDVQAKIQELKNSGKLQIKC